MLLFVDTYLVADTYDIKYSLQIICIELNDFVAERNNFKFNV